MSYFRVVADRGQESADLYLYGIIGQEGNWWDEEEQSKELTDLAVVRAIRELERDYKQINIRINSPGGMLTHGDAIMTAMNNSRAEIHTWNDGVAASMAADIWLCAPNRHMSMHAKTMFHNTMRICFGNAKELRREADILDKMDSISTAMIAQCTGMNEEEVRSKFYNYEDNWLTARECKDYGMISDIEDYSSSAAMPEAPERMSAAELMRYFGELSTDSNASAKPGAAPTRSFLDRLRRNFFGSPEPKPQSNPVTPDIPESQTNPMNIDELRRSLDDSSITEAQLLEVVRERGFTAERTATPEPVLAVTEPAPDTRFAEMERKLDDMMTMLRQQGRAPGALPTPGAPADKDLTVDQHNALEEYNRRQATAAAGNDSVNFVK